MIFNFSDSSLFSGQHGFNVLALNLFQQHLKYNPVYAEYVGFLDKDITKIKECSQIPFMPVELFKQRKVLLEGLTEEQIFESSSTTGIGVSRHYIPDLDNYRASILHTFELFFGPVTDYAFFGLLPGYLNRPNSSLVFMVNYLMECSGYDGGFYIDRKDQLLEDITKAAEHRKIVLFGVTWALLDFAELHPTLPSNITIIETGGMKGRKKELIRTELHQMLKEGFNVNQIYSEYGMTELQSMAYSMNDGLLHFPPWMRIFIADKNDPFTILPPGNTGKICIMDLANHQTCPFLATSDLGIQYENGSVEVLGRTDFSDIRGCSLMAV